MSTDQLEWASPGREVRCSYHPEVMTGLRCSRCGKPICPRCGVRTPVGLRCPDCAGTRSLAASSPATFVKAGAFALLVAVVVGWLWGTFPVWEFYWALLLGFGVCETIARVTRNARGVEWQLLGIAVCVFGLVLSRAVLAQRLGIDLGEISGFRPRLQRDLWLRPIPDLIFAAIPLILNWVRFR